MRCQAASRVGGVGAAGAHELQDVAGPGRRGPRAGDAGVAVDDEVDASAACARHPTR